MKKAGALLLIVVAVAAQNLSPPPWIRQGGVVNAASRLPGALAPGALISIDGLRFVPSDTQVEILSIGRTWPVGVLNATPEHIDARMPVFSGSGPAMLYVISRGKRSVATPVVLSRAAFGIFAKDQDRVARPGSRLTLSGTGLGRSAANEIEVFVADRKSTQVQRGGSKGAESVSFRVPPDTPVGCAVSVTVRIGAATSNSVVIDTGGCGHATDWYSRLHEPGRRTGAAILLRSDVILELSPGKPVPFTVDNAFAAFSARPASSKTSPFDMLPPPGACLAWAGSIDSNNLVLPSFTGTGDDPDLDLGPAAERGANDLEDLDAGPVVTVEGKAGHHSLSRSRRKPRIYTALLGGNPPVTRIAPTPLFLSPGSWSIEVAGGADVGAAKAELEVVDSIRWRNRDAVSMLDRRVGTDLEWTAPAGYAAVVVAWNIDRRNGFGGLTFCRAAAGSTRFHLPATAIANLPVTRLGGSDLSLGFIGIAAVPIDPPAFAVHGLDEARAVFASFSGRTVVVK